jgi:hypothetical protein
VPGRRRIPQGESPPDHGEHLAIGRQDERRKWALDGSGRAQQSTMGHAPELQDAIRPSQHQRLAIVQKDNPAATGIEKVRRMKHLPIV